MNQPIHPPSVLKKPLPTALLDALRALLGDRVVTSEAVRAHHGKDESAHPHAPPDAVVFAQTTEEVAAVVKLCAQHHVPIIPFGARKSSAGYDLTRLFVGSEGTLGVITEVIVRLHPQPEAVSAAICMFPTVDEAVRTVIQTIQMGVPIARCELLDALTIKAVNRYSKLTLREVPMLLCEFHGTPASVEEQ